MNRLPEFNPRLATHRRPAFTTATELDGLIGAGMKNEALALARRLLKGPVVAAPSFSDAVHAILILADRAKPWKALVESAYERIPRSQRRSVRFWIMSVRNVCDDYEGVLRLAPKRFTGKSAALELVWAIDAALETNNEEWIRRLAAHLPRAISQVEDRMTQEMLHLCLAEICARAGAWDEAIAAAELAQESSCFLRNAVTAIVEFHAARAVQALQCGFQKLEACRREFDPEVELMIPGNEKAMLDEAARKFWRLRNKLEKIVPKKRQRELGIG